MYYGSPWSFFPLYIILIIFEEAWCFHFTLGPENYGVHCGCRVSLWTSDGRLGPSNGLLFAPAHLGFPGGASDKEPTYQCRRLKRRRFHPWVGKIPWRTAWYHSSVLAWRIPWTEEPGGLRSLG